MRYTTVQTLLANGFKRTTDSKKIIEIIQNYSNFINSITGQYFYPKQKIISNIVLDEWSRIIVAPDKIPIVKINNIIYKIDNSDIQYILSPNEYIQYERYIELEHLFQIHDIETEILIALGSSYPRFRFTLDGIFGWINKKDIPFETIIIEDFDSSKSSLKLESVDDISPKDFLTIDKYTFLVDTVDYINKVVTFDPVIVSKTVPSGTKAVSYGSIIPDIEYCAIQLCKASAKLENNYGGRILYEKTDRYAVKTTLSISGISNVDMILSNYQPPLYVGFV
ncbi:hypothetical protein [Thermosipho sp. (in: thermotogales)]|jgi:hypothetical protein|uniref:hypothetical protein n=1 Tax=Thermosipho sp. (in: thermotogales) TaxID=1968895 RepID=UPI00257FEC79|nr:hypothetical protein [Thermosipho sp. (in: thermotogales)]MBZ4649186.1 hypothetical protein [Thermosipho sp. (in: thermotogales)]